MPTFKLEEMDDNLPYGGDNDMYFRQWRLPSMKPILDEKLDRDFADAVNKKDEMMRRAAERRQKHSEKYDKKFQNLVKQMEAASINDKKKENVPFLRKPTEQELKIARESLDREFASPSSTARMVPFTGQLRPRANPVFGEKMVGLKNLVLPPPEKPLPTPRDPSFSAHETVFYPQTHDSFNLDHYNGSRPSFAFSGINGATSTPVAKTTFFPGDIPEEEGDDSVFETSKYVTAMESPIQSTVNQQKILEEKMKTAEQRKLELKQAEEAELQKQKEAMKAAEEARVLMAEKQELESKKSQVPDVSSQNPNRFGRGLIEKNTETTGFPETKVEVKSPENGGFSAMFGQKPAGTVQSTFSFGQKPVETKTPQSTLPFGQKPSENSPLSSMFSQKPATTQGTSIFGQKPPQIANPVLARFPTVPTSNPVFDQKPAIPQTERSQSPQQTSENAGSSESVPQQETIKAPTRPYVLFKNYINLLKTIETEKAAYEKSCDPQFRALLKRTIIEKVTVFTNRRTTTEERSMILEFFKSLLQKKEVLGFVVIGDAPKLQLKTDEDFNYAINCIVEKYILSFQSLAALDEELTQTISDLISRLSATHRRIEKVFIVYMFNKSTLLRQNPKECLEKFVDHTTAENSDEKAIEWNQEQALAVLFFTVFTKNAYFSAKGRKMVLNDDLLWKYVETSVAQVLEVPKASFIILQLITTCKPRLHADEDKWTDLLLTIEEDILPELEEDPFKGDEAVIGQLRQMLAVHQG